MINELYVCNPEVTASNIVLTEYIFLLFCKTQNDPFPERRWFIVIFDLLSRSKYIGKAVGMIQ